MHEARATAKYIRTSPQKAKLVLEHIEDIKKFVAKHGA